MKETLQAIRRKTDISTRDIAREAHLPVADVFEVEIGGYTSWEKAQQVVSAFNQLSGMHLTVNEIALTTADKPTGRYADLAAHPIAQVHLSPLRPGLANALRPLLQAHGATIEEQPDGCVVHFPPGTTRWRKVPFVHTTRYDIAFPDGYVLLYEQGRNGKTNLCFDPRDLPAEAVAALQQSDEQHVSIRPAQERERIRNRARAATAQHSKDADSRA